MHRSLSVLAFAVFVASGACSKSNTKLADTTLNTDLQLAAQQRGTQLDSISAAERGVTATSPNGANTAAPTTTTASTATTHHSVTHSRVHHSSESAEASSSGTGTATSSGGTVVKHTQRDAAIGAAAGAVLGATTSRNKVRGGIIGAAVGGLLGGVIGNNVDKSKKPE